MKKIVSLALATTSLSLIPHIAHALTWSFSGFSITDGTNSYSASGSFNLPDSFSGGFNINDTSGLSVSVVTIPGNLADFTFNSSNIDFNSSTFSGTVTGNIASFSTISLLTTTFETLEDSGGNQLYDNLAVFLDTLDDGTTGTSFNNATPEIFEPSMTPGLVALGLSFGVVKITKKMGRNEKE